jgi:hypothetical protein
LKATGSNWAIDCSRRESAFAGSPTLARFEGRREIRVISGYPC